MSVVNNGGPGGKGASCRDPTAEGPCSCLQLLSPMLGQPVSSWLMDGRLNL